MNLYDIDVTGMDGSTRSMSVYRGKKGILGTAAIKWNFNKFLVSAEGAVMRRYASSTTPERIEADVARLLARR